LQELLRVLFHHIEAITKVEETAFGLLLVNFTFKPCIEQFSKGFFCNLLGLILVNEELFECFYLIIVKCHAVVLR